MSEDRIQLHYAVAAILDEDGAAQRVPPRASDEAVGAIIRAVEQHQREQAAFTVERANIDQGERA